MEAYNDTTLLGRLHADDKTLLANTMSSAGPDTTLATEGPSSAFSGMVDYVHASTKATSIQLKGFAYISSFNGVGSMNMTFTFSGPITLRAMGLA